MDEDEDKLAEGQRVVLFPSTFAPDKKGEQFIYRILTNTEVRN